MKKDFTILGEFTIKETKNIKSLKKIKLTNCLTELNNFINKRFKSAHIYFFMCYADYKTYNKISKITLKFEQTIHKDIKSNDTIINKSSQIKFNLIKNTVIEFINNYYNSKLIYSNLELNKKSIKCIIGT